MGEGGRREGPGGSVRDRWAGGQVFDGGSLRLPSHLTQMFYKSFFLQASVEVTCCHGK